MEIRRETWWRAAVAVAIAAALVVVFASDVLHHAVLSVIAAVEQVILRHRVAGAAAFLLLSALSAMLAFLSSAVLVPVAIEAWGRSLTIVLLWLGWILGGACAYAIGRHLGRPAVTRLASARALARYDERISKRTPFSVIVLFQVAVPSEVPGYVLGLARYGFAKYLLVQALVELPWAVGAVLLGQGFLDRQLAVVVVLVAAALVVSAVALRALHARMARTRRSDAGRNGRGGAATRGVVDSRTPEPQS